jgi:shikimate kinase
MIPHYDKIYLIGFMGSGKSTLGRSLARKLGWSFSDMDKMIVQQEGKTIPEIFADYGETRFREIESKMLRTFSCRTNLVISTGGGAPCTGENMDFMLNTGLTVYLKMPPEQLKQRLSDSSGERPLLKGLTGDELLEYIETKLAEREKWYNRAEITVGGTNSLDTSILPIIKMYLNDR